MSGVIVRNLYDPVLYMLKRQKRRITGSAGIGGDINLIKQDNVKEGGQLIRQGNFLVAVEGDEVYRYELYYNEKGILHYFIVINRKTGRIEKWSLEWAPNFTMLVRYNYDLIYDGNDSPDIDEDIDEDL
ncbi:hypothetical protein [Pseudobacillus badius]|uniref:hypothetical protein n=1 Tax=Bacillus badius TaxID=1455 RepID=UPI0005977A51|nr:hypothetical protein [Bacillus badius]KIL71955.1 hypothetical protein SD78_1260 [Bacillus badius]KZN99353.1 hypothetical protein A4244_18695 [Bacillus badius]OCS84942.1 hypothetical protein A6M11_18710 [Bacillus badius]OVE49247.1 hypothetical protein B1A98_16970 [Bacillus badius]TDW00868.1 hypothetical protein B0G66_11568 [Bacillus badius]